MKHYFFAIVFVALAGCAELPSISQAETGATDAEPVVTNESIAAPPPTARTVEQFDTTTDAQRAAASAPSEEGTLIGTTIATLGNAGDPGFWIETVLAKEPGSGRLVYPTNGKEVEVELRPIQEGSSRVSLAVLRLLEAPLTELVTLEVYSN